MNLIQIAIQSFIEKKSIMFLAGSHNLFDERKWQTFDILAMIIISVIALILTIKGVKKVIKFIRTKFDDDPY